MIEDLDKELAETGENLRTQDNRITEAPAFCVQVLERIGPMAPGQTGNTMFYDSANGIVHYRDDSDNSRWRELMAMYEDGDDCLPDDIEVGDYCERWHTVQTCFTEAGCKRYLELDGHNLRHYSGVRIYAESFRRNPEMLAIRKALMETGGLT